MIRDKTGKKPHSQQAAADGKAKAKAKAKADGGSRPPAQTPGGSLSSPAGAPRGGAPRCEQQGKSGAGLEGQAQSNLGGAPCCESHHGGPPHSGAGPAGFSGPERAASKSALSEPARMNLSEPARLKRRNTAPQDSGKPACRPPERDDPSKNLRLRAVLRKKALLFPLIFLAALAALHFFGLFEHLSFERLKEGSLALRGFYSEKPFLAISAWFSAYVFTASFSLPFTAVMTLAGGFVFGAGLGTLLSSFASVSGATVSFWISRRFLRNFVRTKLQRKLQKALKGFEEAGAFYLFALRMIPMAPFFLINILMGLTNIKTRVFFIVSQTAMLPGTFLYAYAGGRLSQMERLSDVMSPPLLISFAGLGALPLAARKIIQRKFKNLTDLYGLDEEGRRGRRRKRFWL